MVRQRPGGAPTDRPRRPSYAVATGEHPGLGGPQIDGLSAAWGSRGGGQESWDGIRRLVGRFISSADGTDREIAWHHLVMAVGNFERQGGTRIHVRLPDEVEPGDAPAARRSPTSEWAIRRAGFSGPGRSTPRGCTTWSPGQLRPGETRADQSSDPPRVGRCHGRDGRAHDGGPEGGGEPRSPPADARQVGEHGDDALGQHDRLEEPHQARDVHVHAGWQSSSVRLNSSVHSIA